MEWGVKVSREKNREPVLGAAGRVLLDTHQSSELVNTIFVESAARSISDEQSGGLKPCKRSHR